MPKKGKAGHWAWAAVLLAVALFLATGPASVDASEPDLEILLTRDLRGWLFPCDCKAGLLGGFPRRATLIERELPDLLLDAGDLVFQASPYDLLKYRFMLSLSAALGYDAVNVGKREAGFSKAEIERIAGESKVPLISANLADESGAPVLPGRHVLERDGRKIAILGLLTRTANPGEGLTVLDPARALSREIERLAAEADLVVLLSALTTPEMESLLTQVEGVDLLLGGLVPRGTERLEAIAGVPCFLVKGKGQYTGEVALTEREGRLAPMSGRRRILSPDLDDDPEIRRRIKVFERSLEDLDLLERRENESPYAGSRSCAACHEAEHAQWSETAHAKALSALTPEKGRYDPMCLSCHTTGAGKEGYVSEERTPALADVGCETCHGPSRSHAEAPLLSPRKRTLRKPASTCLDCHESDHSEPFDLTERLARIRHEGGSG